MTILNAFLFILLSDAYAYWQHRAFHRFAPRLHSIHHRQKFNVLMHPIEQALNWAILPVGYLLGFTTLEMVPVLIWGMMFIYRSHMAKKPRYESWLFMSSRKHEVHHDTYDKNYGPFFTIWDRIMGTYT